MAIGRNDRPRPSSTCFEKALDLLSRRPHFRRELERKLLMRKYEPAEVTSALDRAVELGFLNDLECARELARVRVERRHEGPAKLLGVLARKGVDPETARLVAEEYFSEGEDRQLRAAAGAWLSRHAPDPRRLARHLSAKGFSKGGILSAVERLETSGDHADVRDEEGS